MIALDLDHPPGPASSGKSDRVRDRDAAKVIVLDEHAFGEAPTMVDPSTCTHCRLLEGAQSRSGLAGVGDPHSWVDEPCRLDIGTGESRHPGEVRDEIERGPLRCHKRAERARELGNDAPGSDRSAVGDTDLDREVRIDHAAHFEQAGNSRDDALATTDKPSPDRALLGDELGGQVPERQEIFTKRESDDLADRDERGLEVDMALGSGMGVRSSGPTHRSPIARRTR
jgi:hypothetical protein